MWAGQVGARSDGMLNRTHVFCDILEFALCKNNGNAPHYS